MLDVKRVALPGRSCSLMKLLNDETYLQYIIAIRINLPTAIVIFE